jgi:hypothetical protein
VRELSLSPRSWLAVTLVSVAIPAGFVALLDSWHGRWPGEHVSGLFQGDMLTYLCNARQALRSATGLSYASPFDLREPPRALLVQLSSSPSWTLRGAHGPFRDFARREPNLSGD